MVIGCALKHRMYLHGDLVFHSLPRFAVVKCLPETEGETKHFSSGRRVKGFRPTLSVSFAFRERERERHGETDRVVKRIRFSNGV